jgi:hypothetical protein
MFVELNLSSTPMKPPGVLISRHGDDPCWIDPGSDQSGSQGSILSE